jgi:hypothetical protein
MARQERLALADSRAMAKQGERENAISEVRGGNRMVGCGEGSMGHHHGYHLGQHLGRMKGHPYSHDFVEGVMGGVMDAGEFKRRSMAGGSGQYDGEGFWGDLWSGVKKVGRNLVAPVGNALGSMVGVPIAGSLASGALGMAGLGKGRKKHTLKDHLEHPNKGFGNSGGASGGFGHMVYLPASQSVSFNGKAPRGRGASGGKRKPSDALQRRAKLIAKLRQEEGMSMIEASKYIKAKGLKY